ncbi:hypothetical protein CONPUDRAFT_80577, partial [Coniophora puteana RWD-64-598 SS2]
MGKTMRSANRRDLGISLIELSKNQCARSKSVNGGNPVIKIEGEDHVDFQIRLHEDPI